MTYSKNVWLEPINSLENHTFNDKVRYSVGERTRTSTMY